MKKFELPKSLWNFVGTVRRVHLVDSESALSEFDAGELVRANNFYSPDANPLGQGIQTSAAERFALVDDGEIVYDRSTGLSWQRSGSSSEVTLAEAHSYARELARSRYGNLGSWCLPTLAEAMSLVVPQAENYNHAYPHLVPLHNASVFDPTQRWIWIRNDTPEISQAWIVQFAQGGYHAQDREAGCYVRAVTRDIPGEARLKKIDPADLRPPVKMQPATPSVYGGGECNFCKGTGKQPCQVCNGSGSMKSMFPGMYQTQYTTSPCPNCSGTGLVKCSRCHGFG